MRRLIEVEGDPDDPAVDAAIRSSLEETPPESWEELRTALEAVEALPTDGYCTWTQTGNFLPWPTYAPAVDRLRNAIAAAGLVVLYRWPDWAGIQRYRGGSGMDTAPVEDAVRMATAVLRSERFTDGSIDGALGDGTLQSAVRRVLSWADSR